MDEKKCQNVQNMIKFAGATHSSSLLNMSLSSCNVSWKKGKILYG